jgi:hypothetical protein
MILNLLLLSKEINNEISVMICYGGEPLFLLLRTKVAINHTPCAEYFLCGAATEENELQWL